MINNQLLDYVKQQLSLNVGKETIIANSKSAGWTDEDINEVFTAIGTSTTSAPVSIPPVGGGVMPNSTTTQANFPSSTTHTKSKKMIPIIVILILLCLAGGVAGYAYYTGLFVTLPSLISEYKNNFKNVTTEKYDFSLNVDFSELKSTSDGSLDALSYIGISSKNAIFNVNGVSDVSDIKNPKVSSSISFDMGKEVSLGVEIRLIDKILYVKVPKSPVFSSSPLPISLSSYVNKWFSVPVTTLSSFNKNNITLTTEQQDHIYQLSKDANFIKTVARLNPETVGGKLSFHYSFDLDRDGIISYLQALNDYMQTIYKDSPEMSAGLSSFDSKEVTSMLDQIKDFKGEIWIGRSDKLIHKVSVDFGVQLDSKKNEKVKFNIVAVLSDYNEPVSIVVPADSTSLETLINSSRQKGKEATIKANLSSTRAEAEIFYDKESSYSGFCASSNLISVKSDVEDSGGTEFVCKATSKAYAISAKLPTGNYWCIDSSGAYGETLTSSTGKTVCPQKIQASNLDSVDFPVVPTN